jgi:hypothetical protein
MLRKMKTDEQNTPLNEMLICSICLTTDTVGMTWRNNMNRRKALLVLASAIVIPVVGYNFDDNSSGTLNGQNGVEFNHLPASIRYIVDDIGIDGLQKLKNLSVSDGSFGMIEVSGYLIDGQDWDLYLKEDFS